MPRALLVRIVLVSCAASWCLADEPPWAPVEAALQARDYAEAIRRADTALAAADGDAREPLLYRRGLALFYAERFEEAIAAFDAQAREFPEGAWRAKARFRQADALVRLSRYGPAQEIYAAEVSRLLGAERKASLADVYIRFARDYFAPQDALTAPNYERALKFYEQALELEPAAEMRDELLFRVAVCKAKLNDPAAAVERFERYLLTFDDAFRALWRETHLGQKLPPAADRAGAHTLAARAALGEALLSAGRVVAARGVLEDLLALLSEKADNSEQAAQAQLDALRLLALTHGMPNPPTDDALNAGVAALRRLIAAFPERVEAVTAAQDIAAAQAARGRFDEALEAYTALVEKRALKPASDAARDAADVAARTALFRIGELHYGRGQYVEAIAAWNQYISNYANGPEWAAAQGWIIHAEFAIGQAAAEARDFEKAVAAWSEFIQKHPLDPRVPATLNQFARFAFERQEQIEKDGGKPDWSEPVAAWRRVVNKYPQHEEAGLAQYRIAETYEQKIGDLEKAIEEYEKLGWSEWADDAQAALARMRSASLDVLTERSFRTSEPATLRVDVRNVDRLTLKLYRIDLEAYFRKQHALDGVESLDLALIDPDKTIEVDVKNYARYRPVTQHVELPVEGAAVYAVTVTSENSTAKVPNATLGKLEATTLVLRSDIDLIVKSSRKQILAFAQNRATNEPAADVRILVSDGSKVFLEGRTGADGVWTAADKHLQESGSLRVLGIADGHVAGIGLEIGDLAFSSGLAARGYLYTDRPGYQPGDAVNIRGVLREVRDGQYVLPTQPEDPRQRWKLDIVDPKGRLLRSENIELSSFGTIASQFVLGADAATGEYRMNAHRAGGPTFSSTFAVRTYTLPTATLEFEFDEPIIVRGERISGVIRARYNYGEPVRDKPIEYAIVLPSGETLNRSGVTDAEGELKIEVDGRILPEEGQVGFQATQAELGIQAAGAVYVAPRAFVATVSTPRGLYLSQEPIEVKVRASDLRGEPLGQSLKLSALLRREHNGQWSDALVESAEIRTDEKEGVARHSLKLEKGGVYTLRVEGEDRNGRIVTAVTRVRISDAEDETRLRLFSDRQHYKVGEAVTLNVHSRIEAGGAGRLALLTLEGEELIGHRLIRVKPGHNEVEIPVEHAHFPNFAVGVALLDGTRLHDATRGFSVERQLQVTIKPNRETYRPREEMTLDVEVTDHLGKPVSAEVGIAMIDSALLAVFADGTPHIVAAFQEGAVRNAAMRTLSSCVFAYHATTRGMSSEVLGEVERQVERMARLAPSSQPPPPASARDRGLRAAGRGGGQGGSGGAGSIFLAERLEEVLDADRAARLLDQFNPADEAQIAQILSQAEGVELYFGASQSGGVAFNYELDGAETRTATPLVGDIPIVGSLFHSAAEDPSSVGYAAGGRMQMSADAAREALGQRITRAYAGLAAEKDFSKRVSFGKSLNELIQAAPPRTYFPELAYWNPHVVTDEAGKARVTVVLPDTNTRWRILARGVTADTLVGQETTHVVTRTDFFAEIAAPRQVMQGDTFRVRARVHCLAEYKGKLSVTLLARRADAAGVAGALQQQTLQAECDGPGVYEVEFDALRVDAAADLVLDVSAATDAAPAGGDAPLRYALSSDVRVAPWGIPVEVSRAGVGRDSDFVELTLPAPPQDGPYAARRLTIAVGPGMQRWMIEEALETGDRWGLIDDALHAWRVAPPRSNADVASALIGALYVADYVRSGKLGAAHDVQPADLRLLEDRIAGLTAQLLAVQRDDGGWSWCGQSRERDAWTTAHVAWALGKARSAGYAVWPEALGKLTASLQQLFAAAQTDETDLKAVILHGLSWIGEIDFAHANRLYRNRDGLSSAATAYLALTFVRLERTALAAEMLGALEHRFNTVDDRGGRRAWVPCQSAHDWIAGDLETTSLALLAQLEVDRTSPHVEALVRYLSGQARADGWRPHKARGPALAALATHYAGVPEGDANFRLKISANGRALGTVDERTPGSLRFDLRDDALAGGTERVEFEFDGRGEYTWTVTLSAFSAHVPENSEPAEPLAMRARQAHPPKLRFEGREVDPGFSTVHDVQWFGNYTTHAAVGSVVRVHVPIWRIHRRPGDFGRMEYFVVQERIPAGFRLLESTIRSNHDAYDYSGGLLTLYYGRVDSPSNLDYEMVATTEGEYRTPPTIGRRLYGSESVTMSPRPPALTVLPRGTPNPDEYRLTPDERYRFGELYFTSGQVEPAVEHLRAFLSWTPRIHDEPYRNTIRMLLECAIKLNDDGGIVDSFEILKEKYPDLYLPFEQMARVAAAYANTRQDERAYLVYRAIADASFAADAGISGVLREEGLFLESIDFLLDLWRAHPDTPSIVSVHYATTQTLYAQAESARQTRPRGGPDAAQPTRESLIREAIALLERLLALYPTTPIADEASYSLANAYLDLDDYERVLALSGEFAARFPESRWLDRFRYLQSLALFQLGRFDEARELAQTVSTSKWRDAQGVEQESPNKWLALYIIAQIYHAERDYKRALEYYEQVKTRFSDAADAAAFFEHRALRAPEVTIFHPDGGGFREAGEWAEQMRTQAPQKFTILTDDPTLAAAARQPGGLRAANGAPLYPAPFVELTYRNAGSAQIQVYRVDLMKLALLEKNLTEITSVNLSGIRPLVDKAVRLEGDARFAPRSMRVELPELVKQGARQDGAYLVICRAEDLYATGLVLITPLALDVQEDVGADRVRVHVVDAITRGGVKGVHVKVIGTSMSRFVSGASDLRGVFAADGISGYPTAIARDDDGRFAFFRSEDALIVAAAAKKMPAPKVAEAEDKAVDYRGNLRGDNRQIQLGNDLLLKEAQQMRKRAVQVQSAQ